MGGYAIRAGLGDAGWPYTLVQQTNAGYVYGDSRSGQSALYRVGITGIPVVDASNNCAGGSLALWPARQAADAGIVDCALAVGFEQMHPGELKKHWADRPNPTQRHGDVCDELHGVHENVPNAARLNAP